MRTLGIAASIAALVLVTGVAQAQEPAKGGTGAVLPPEPEAVDYIGAEHFFAVPVTLGDAWARAVNAALDRMRHLVDAEQMVAQGVLGAAAHRPKPPAWAAPLPRPPKATTARFVVQPAPYVVEPVTAAVVDTHGEYAVLPGARVELPWMVP